MSPEEFVYFVVGGLLRIDIGLNYVIALLATVLVVQMVNVIVLTRVLSACRLMERPQASNLVNVGSSPTTPTKRGLYNADRTADPNNY